MKKPLSSIAVFLPTLTLVFTLLFGLVCAVLFQLSLEKAQRDNTNTLGAILAKELAASSLQSLLHRDTLSIQVAVTEFSTIPGVSHASVYDAKKQPIAQSNRLTTLSSLAFSAPVLLEGEPSGSAKIILDQAFFDAPYKQFILWSKILWLTLSIIAVVTAAWYGKKWRKRLINLAKRIPRAEIDSQGCEMDQLEQALEPILHNASPAIATKSTNNYQAILSISCRNFTRLQTQLSEDNFRDVLGNLDEIISFVLKLYAGQRLTTYKQTISLVFEGVEPDSDHCLRALYAAFSSLQLIEQLQASKSLKIDCAFAITCGANSGVTNHIQSALLMEKQLNQCDALLEIASISEIVLDRATGTHKTLDDTALLEPLSPDEQMFRCDGLEETAATLVKRQLAFFAPNQQTSQEQN